MKDLQQKKKQAPKVQQTGKEKVPWLFGLEIKDLTHPITIRRIRLLQGAILLAIMIFGGNYVWENFLRAPTGYELVNDMVDAAGGMEAWNNINSGQFTRTQNVYDQAGNQLSEQVETFYFRKTDEGLKLMVKAIDNEGKEVIISEDQEGFWATKEAIPTDPKETSRDLGMMCDSKYCQPTCA